MKRDLKIYIPIMLILFATGIVTRVGDFDLPDWYINYAGDFLWAMLFFFLYCLIFRLTTAQAFIFTLITTYFIEFTQLFHPPWLETLRSYKMIGLVIGYSFIWSDIIAYTLGITLGALIDTAVTRTTTQTNESTS